MAGGDPYCSNCDYSLVGLTDSAKCPECGKPIIQVLQRRGTLVGRRYTSDIVIFGLPLLQIAMGPSGNERLGRARGIIAIGDVARGWIALGGRCFGIVACGGFAVGVVSLGGMSVGLLSFGGLAIGGLVAGGLGAGVIANGGLALGYVAQGGMAIGYFARGGKAVGAHTADAIMRDAGAIGFFEEWSWFFGTQASMVWSPHLWLLAGMLTVAGVVGLIITLGYVRATTSRN